MICVGKELRSIHLLNIYCTLRAVEYSGYMEKEMTIRQISEILGVSRRTVQIYEANHLITSCGKTKYGHLLYDEPTVRHIAVIRFFQNLGMSLKEIRTFITADSKQRHDIYRCTLISFHAKMLNDQNLYDTAEMIDSMICLPDFIDQILHAVSSVQKEGKQP